MSEPATSSTSGSSHLDMSMETMADLEMPTFPPETAISPGPSPLGTPRTSWHIPQHPTPTLSKASLIASTSSSPGNMGRTTSYAASNTTSTLDMPTRPTGSHPHLQAKMPVDLEADRSRPALSNQSSSPDDMDMPEREPDAHVHAYPPQPPSSAIVMPLLPPTDTGYRAWSFLAAATTIECMVWGLPFSVGILHVYWLNVMFQGQGESVITLAATLQTGLMYMSAGVLGPIFAAFPRYTKHIQVMGLVVSVIALIGTAFVTKPWHLIVSFGCLYPFAGATYLPCATLLFEWFSARRGQASGIMYAGTGIGGTIFPFMMTWLLDRWGYRAAMITLGLAWAILGGTSLLFIQRRVPLPTRNVDAFEGTRRKTVDWSVFGSRTFVFGILTILVTSLGNFVPSLWLPSFADDLKMSPSGVGLIALMNAASVPGNALMGFLSDLLPIHVVIIISCLGSALSCVFLWGFGLTSGPLIAFVLVFGVLGLSFSAAWSKMISTICGEDPASIALVFSLFATTRGVGNFSSGPIADALLRVDSLRGAAGAYGYKNYGVLLVYTGISICAGCLTGLPFKQ